MIREPLDPMVMREVGMREFADGLLPAAVAYSNANITARIAPLLVTVTVVSSDVRAAAIFGSPLEAAVMGA